MKKGVCIIFENDKNEILLFLRDKKSTIPYPNQWDFLGGGVEEGESPKRAIVREIREELELNLKDFHVFRVYRWPEQIETVFHKKLNIDITKTNLHEGQKIKYFSKSKLLSMDLAFHDNQIVRDFFK